MIPQLNLTAWSAQAPWPELRQVEQDLIIARAIVAIFSDPVLASELRFRGGTALNKLHFPAPLRYSEDIDLVRTAHGPIGPILDRLRVVLEPWLGPGAFDQSRIAPKLRFRTPSEEDAAVEIRLKIEINTSEIDAYDPPLSITYAVDNPWFAGQAQVATFSREEMMATKLRALLQRDKGRDLFDLAHALDVFQDLNIGRVIELFGAYLARTNLRVTRAEAEQRMFAKLARPAFMQDMRPLLPPAAASALTDDNAKAAFTAVFRAFIWALPGASWEKSVAMAETLKAPHVVQVAVGDGDAPGAIETR
jgi:predicted nucleotidyltransferase component of viral defense system